MLAGVAIVGIAAAASADGSHGRGARDGSSRLAMLEAQHQQLEGQLGQCVPQLSAALQQQAAASMNGQFYTAEPACAAYMAGWTAELAMVEKEIYQLQTGANVPVTEFASSSSSSSSAAPSSGNSNRALDAVDRYDRNAIRGTGNYTDETGETRELPLAPNYWRNPASGDIVPTETPDAPADGRDWQRMQPEE